LWFAYFCGRELILESNIKMDLQEEGRKGAWTGLIWLRIEMAGGLHFNYTTTTVSALQHK
jgi:hypothetical protein